MGWMDWGLTVEEGCSRRINLGHNDLMSLVLDIPDSLRDRVEAIAKRSNLTPSQVISDALQNGHSLEWQERFLAKVEAGLDDADNGNFVSDEDLAFVLGKYRPS